MVCLGLSSLWTKKFAAPRPASSGDLNSKSCNGAIGYPGFILLRRRRMTSEDLFPPAVFIWQEEFSTRFNCPVHAVGPLATGGFRARWMCAQGNINSKCWESLQEFDNTVMTKGPRASFRLIKNIHELAITTEVGPIKRPSVVR
jgi:hypothetical protein